MRWVSTFAFVFAVVVGLVLVGQAFTEEPAAKPGPVQIDLSKLSPEVAKRLTEELAKQKKAASATADKKAKAAEAPTKGKPEAKPGAAAKPGEPPNKHKKPGEKPSGDKKPAEKEKEPEKK